MKHVTLSAIAIAVAALAAAPSQAVDFSFSFVDDYYGHPELSVTGTITGLNEGYNDAVALQAYVTDSPIGGIGGPYLPSDGYFVVTNGQITEASAYFYAAVGAGYYALLLGTDPGGSSYYPELFDFNSGNDLASSHPVTFAELSPAPEAASWVMMVGGFGLVGGALRVRRKVAVSFA
jgi:hypothetical protein